MNIVQNMKIGLICISVTIATRASLATGVYDTCRKSRSNTSICNVTVLIEFNVWMTKLCNKTIFVFLLCLCETLTGSKMEDFTPHGNKTEDVLGYRYPCG